MRDSKLNDRNTNREILRETDEYNIINRNCHGFYDDGDPYIVYIHSKINKNLYVKYYDNFKRKFISRKLGTEKSYHGYHINSNWRPEWMLIKIEYQPTGELSE